MGASTPTSVRPPYLCLSMSKKSACCRQTNRHFYTVSICDIFSPGIGPRSVLPLS